MIDQATQPESEVLRAEDHPLYHDEIREGIRTLRAKNKALFDRLAAVPVLAMQGPGGQVATWAGLIPLLSRQIDQEIAEESISSDVIVADALMGTDATAIGTDATTKVVEHLMKVAKEVERDKSLARPAGVIDSMLFGDYTGLLERLGWTRTAILARWNDSGVNRDKSFFTYRITVCDAIKGGEKPSKYYGVAASTAYKQVRAEKENSKRKEAGTEARPAYGIAGGAGAGELRRHLERQAERLERAATRIERATTPRAASKQPNGEKSGLAPVRHLVGRCQDLLYPNLNGGINTIVDVPYALVELEDIVPSHNPQNGFLPHPSEHFPTGIQERAYHLRGLAKQAVKDASGRLEPALLLDRSCLATIGPPTVTALWPGGEEGFQPPRFWVASGNQRVMMLTLACYAGSGKGNFGYRQYRDEIARRAKEFGFREEHVRPFKNPVLVRILEESDDFDATSVVEFAHASNVSLMKAHSAVEASIPLAKRLLGQPQALDLLQGFDTTKTVRENLSKTASGREFARTIRPIIPSSQHPEVFRDSPTGAVSDGQDSLTAWGRLLVENALWLACFDGMLCDAPPLDDGDGDLDAPYLIDSLSDEYRRKLLRSVPRIVQANAPTVDPEYRLARLYFHALKGLLSSDQKSLWGDAPDRAVWLQRFLLEVHEPQRRACHDLYVGSIPSSGQEALQLGDEGKPPKFSAYASLPPLGLELVVRAIRHALGSIEDELPRGRLPGTRRLAIPDEPSEIKQKHLQGQRNAVLDIAKWARMKEGGSVRFREVLLQPDPWERAVQDLQGKEGSPRRQLVSRALTDHADPEKGAQFALNDLLGTGGKGMLSAEEVTDSMPNQARRILAYFGSGDST
jgi:hypothetical protein